MLRKFAVENYRGFRNRVELDLSRVRDYSFHTECIRNGLIDRCMIVGRNGCGKTDLGLALFDITQVLTGRRTANMKRDSKGFLNRHSGKPFATFLYVFELDDHEIEYEYRKTSPNDITYERMAVDGRTLFIRDGDTMEGMIEAKELRLDHQDGPTSVLRIMHEVMDQPDESPVSEVMGFVKGMLYVGSSPKGDACICPLLDSEPIRDYIVRNGLVEDLDQTIEELSGQRIGLGIVGNDESEGGLVSENLDFDSSASEGTRMLMVHCFWMRRAKDITFAYFDGFDAFYHFELAERMLLRMCEEMNAQCMFTSHNTSLVSNRILRPDCYMFMDSRGIASLPDLTGREIREGHNLERLLRGGEFDV